MAASKVQLGLFSPQLPEPMRLDGAAAQGNLPQEGNPRESL